MKLSAVIHGSDVNPCCCSCSEVVGGEIDCVISGVTACPCRGPDVVNGGQFASDFHPSILSGMNGVFMGIPYVGGNSWKLLGAGVASVAVYDSTDGTCSGELIDTVFITFDLNIACDTESGLFSIQAIDNAAGFYQFILNIGVPLGGTGTDTSTCGSPGILFVGGKATPSAPT